MAFIANYWTNQSSTSVIVYSNCEDVELRLNGVKIMKNARQQQHSSQLLRAPFIFDIDRFIPGRLDAIGYIKDKAVVRSHQLTPGHICHHLNIKMDLSGQSLVKNDLVFVYAFVCDENDIVIPDANDLITFSIRGVRDNVSLIGDNPVRAEAGIASILLKTSNNYEIVGNVMTLTAQARTVKHKATINFSISRE